MSNTIDLNLDLSKLRKKRISVNGDETKVIELDLSDMFIVQRLETIYPKLRETCDYLAKLDVEETDDGYKQLTDALSKADNEMRNQINEIFEFDVCSVCMPTGHVYDMVNGEFRFEILIEALSGLYENSFREEYKRMQMRINKKTSKYTGKKK